MEIALSPREIQARIRSGASVAEVAEAAGVDAARIEGFAGPVLAEREHMARTALQSTIRRRGNGHRKLLDVISERLQARGVDVDGIAWDSWRLPDLRWQVVGTIKEDAADRSAEFIFDPRGRFSVADNADARWMIGEELPGSGSPDNENTVDFDDELALVRATQDKPAQLRALPGDDVPRQDALYEITSHTSELDELYDLMSGISEDSVRIYVGLTEEAEPIDRGGQEPQADADAAADEPAGEPATAEESAAAESTDDVPTEVVVVEEVVEEVRVESVEELPAREEAEREAEPAPKPTPKPGPKPGPAATTTTRRRRRRRAEVPSWDEIMFGGPEK